MHGSRFHGREKLFNPEGSDWPEDDNDHGANWDYVLTILGSFGLFVLLVTVGMLAWILGII